MPRRCCGHGCDHAELTRAPPSITQVHRPHAPRMVPPEGLSVCARERLSPEPVRVPSRTSSGDA